MERRERKKYHPNPGATLPVEMYTVQYIGLQWPLCTTTGWSHKFAAAAALLPTPDSPRATLREGLLYSRTPSLPSKPKASRSPRRAHTHPAHTGGCPQWQPQEPPIGMLKPQKALCRNQPQSSSKSPTNPWSL